MECFAAADIAAFAGNYKVNKKVVTDTWTPGMVWVTALQATVENSKTCIVQQFLFVGLSVRVGHKVHLNKCLLIYKKIDILLYSIYIKLF